jgi:mycofactocin system glycosyltransferase
VASPSEQPVPDGWQVVLDPRTRRLDRGRALLTPTGRLLRLSARGPEVVAALPRGAHGGAARRLARTLLDAGAGHPRPDPVPPDDVTVVVPVRDRLTELDRCLAALREHPHVLVVDDGSAAPARVAAVAARHGARCVHRGANGGPAAARNTARGQVGTPFVAFLDSDCVVPPGWLAVLRGHLADPAVAAVAPRVVGGPRSPLDLGPDEGVVRPGSALAYVPTAALLVRVEALPAFDEALRYGEDVDLVWRLVEAGWTVRYDPSVTVEHAEPVRLADRLVRRHRYGTSAAPLALRHPGHLAHLVLPPWPTAVVALLLARRPVLATAAAAVAAARLDRTVGDPATSARLVGSATAGTALGLGRALALAGPLAWVAAGRDRRVAALLVAPLVREWWHRGRPGDPARYVGRALLDDAAYGSGVVAGCVRHRTGAPLRPRLR